MIIYVMLKLHEASRILHTVSDGWGEQVILLGIDHRELNLVIIVRDALEKQSRPIEYSLCIWGRANVWTWGPQVVSLGLISRYCLA